MKIITLDLVNGEDLTYTIEEALADIEYQAENRNLWVYDSATNSLWFKDKLREEWAKSYYENEQYYMTHLFHNHVLTEFEGTTTYIPNYMRTLR